MNAAQPAAAALRVLVVDDESLVRWSLEEVLNALGHRVECASDGLEAARMLSEAALPPDVVLLDYRLPGGNGLTLVPKIRAVAPKSRIILMTAYGSPDLVAHALALGVDRVVDKPIDVDEVAELVA